MGRVLQLLVKVTRECNLRCGYCNDWRQTSPVLSMENMEQLCRTALNDTAHPTVAFVWHGGEPTLVPVDYYERVVELQQRYNVRGKVVLNALQTNATHITPEWIDFLKCSDFGLSISLDGPPEVHGRTRPNIAGHSSFPAIEKNIRRLRAADIPFGTLFVLSEDLLALGAEALWQFIVDYGLNDLEFIPARPPNLPGGVKIAPTRDPQFITHDRWIRFMIELFDLWWASDGGIRVKMLESVLSRLIDAEPQLCLIGGGCFGSVFAVEPDGLVTACDIFHGEQRFDFGQLGTTSFAEIARSAQMAGVKQWNENRLSGMRACAYFQRCNGGCPHDAVVYEMHGATALLEGCCGWEPIFAHAEQIAGPDLRSAAAQPRQSLPVLSVTT